jgi:hypothetical protein
MDFANMGYGIANPAYCAIVKPISPFSLHQQLLYLWAITVFSNPDMSLSEGGM